MEFVNILSTDSLDRILAPVVGEVPSLRSVAMISEVCSVVYTNGFVDGRVVLTAILGRISETSSTTRLEDFSFWTLGLVDSSAQGVVCVGGFTA